MVTSRPRRSDMVLLTRVLCTVPGAAAGSYGPVVAEETVGAC